MSVEKSKRSVPNAKFMQDVFNVRKKTLEVLKKFPKGYKFNLPSRIAELADNAYRHAHEGNSVYMHKGMPYQDYLQRRKSFLQSYQAVKALTAETTFCHDLLMEGENFFENAKLRDATMSEWTRLCTISASSMKGILEADKKRYKGYVMDRQEDPADRMQMIEKTIDAMQEKSKEAIMEMVQKSLI